MGKQAEVREVWRQRIAEQEQSGLSVRAYCRERSLGEYSFYSWRRRMRDRDAAGGVSFALVESQAASAEPGMLELVLSEGERLRIPCQEAALGLVLRVLRSAR
jgi:hypothetical protein